MTRRVLLVIVVATATSGAFAQEAIELRKPHTVPRATSEVTIDGVIDELERDFFVQLLFSYKVNPRTVFFAGYTEGGFENQDFTMTTTGRAVFLKIGYAWLW